MYSRGFPGGYLGRNPPARAGDTVSIPDPGRPQCHGGLSPCDHLWLSLCSVGHEPRRAKPRCPRAEAPRQGKRPQRESRTPQLEKGPLQQGRPNAAEKKQCEARGLAEISVSATFFHSGNRAFPGRNEKSLIWGLILGFPTSPVC